MKEQYMKELEEKLACFHEETREEILEDYEQHFAEGAAAGLSEEEIIRELGDIQEMINELPQQERSLESKENVKSNPFEQVSYDATSCKSAIIETTAIDIEAVTSLDDQIHVDYVGSDKDRILEKCDFYQYEKDGVFYAGLKDKECEDEIESTGNFIKDFFRKHIKGSIHVTFGEGKLLVMIPSSISSLELHAVSGDVTVTKAMIDSLFINSVSGDVNTSSVKAKNVKANTVSGDVTVDICEFENAETNSTSGDVEVKNSQLRILSAKSMSGDVECDNIISEIATLNSMSGDVEYKGKATKVSIDTKSGDAEVTVAGIPEEINVCCLSGDVEVELLDATAGQIDATTRSGDIRLQFAGQVMNSETNHFSFTGTGTSKIYAKTSSGDCIIRTK